MNKFKEKVLTVFPRAIILNNWNPRWNRLSYSVRSNYTGFYLSENSFTEKEAWERASRSLETHVARILGNG